MKTKIWFLVDGWMGSKSSLRDCLAQSKTTENFYLMASLRSSSLNRGEFFVIFCNRIVMFKTFLCTPLLVDVKQRD